MSIRKPRPMSRRPSVSVVIPCYNYGHFLPSAVASALHQDGVNVDVLIVDDASTDGSDQVAAKLGQADPRVDVLLHETNAGHIQTYNDGLARVSGEYVVLLSADDMLAPGSLSRSVALLESEPDVALVYGFPADFTTDPPEPHTRVRSWTVWDGPDWIARVCARGRNIIVNPEVVLRTSVMQDLVGYGSDHPHAADLELWLRAAVRGRVGRVNGAHQAYYRVHGGNMHSTRFDGRLTDAHAVRRVFDDFFTVGDGRLLSGSDRLHRRARGSMAQDTLRAACLLLDTDHAARTDAEALAEFAADSSPTIVHSRLWRAWLERQDGRASASRRTGLALIDRVRWVARWRRWRRWGH